MGDEWIIEAMPSLEKRIERRAEAPTTLSVIDDEEASAPAAAYGEGPQQYEFNMLHYAC